MASLNLYTPGPLIKSSVTDVTSETTGFPIENAFDNNPDTFWRPTSTIPQTIDIDLGEVVEVDALGVWLLFSDGDVDLYSDNDDDGNYSAVTLQATVVTDGTNIGINDIGSTVSKRYWRIIYTYGGGPFIYFHNLWLLKKSTIAKSSQLPRNDITRYHNQISLAGGGREFVRGINSNSETVLPRTYLIEQSDFTELKAAFDDVRGRLLPLIIVESGETTRLVRFTSNDLAQNEIAHEMFNPSFGFIELPFIPRGELF